MKRAILLLSFLLTTQAFAKDYIVVGVAGFATKKEGRGQPSGVHDNLPTRASNIRQSFKLVHFSKKAELQEVIDQFDCIDGKQREPNLGLIVMINSWGAGNGFKLTQMYQEQCGRIADAAYLVDGVSKPIGPFSKAPIAKKCVSYYQTKGAVHGKAIEGCYSEDYTNRCEKLGYGPIQCHIAVEWWGSARAADELKLSFLR